MDQSEHNPFLVKERHAALVDMKNEFEDRRLPGVSYTSGLDACKRFIRDQALGSLKTEKDGKWKPRMVPRPEIVLFCLVTDPRQKKVGQLTEEGKKLQESLKTSSKSRSKASGVQSDDKLLSEKPKDKITEERIRQDNKINYKCSIFVFANQEDFQSPRNQEYIQSELVVGGKTTLYVCEVLRHLVLVNPTDNPKDPKSPKIEVIDLAEMQTLEDFNKQKTKEADARKQDQVEQQQNEINAKVPAVKKPRVPRTKTTPPVIENYSSGHCGSVSYTEGTYSCGSKLYAGSTASTS